MKLTQKATTAALMAVLPPYHANEIAQEREFNRERTPFPTTINTDLLTTSDPGFQFHHDQVPL